MLAFIPVWAALMPNVVTFVGQCTSSYSVDYSMEFKKGRFEHAPQLIAKSGSSDLCSALLYSIVILLIFCQVLMTTSMGRRVHSTEELFSLIIEEI